ncbi:MAG: hypothetical protein U0271_35760 [Polyangiaceae bacterium]
MKVLEVVVKNLKLLTGLLLGAALIGGCGDDSTGGGGTGATNNGGDSQGGAGGNPGTGGNPSTGGQGGEGGSVPPPECGLTFDDRPDCEACMDNSCCTEEEACGPGSDCEALLICANACAEGDQPCVDACIADHAQGLTDIQAVFACYDASCKTDVACAFPICDSGLVYPDEACATCLTDSTSCCASATACAGDQACLACLSDPMTAGCDTNTNYQAILACSTGAPPNCGPSCATNVCDSGLGYPNNASCNFCLGESCCAEMTACAADTAADGCLDCITGSASAGANCDANTAFAAIKACDNTNCQADGCPML